MNERSTIGQAAKDFGVSRQSVRNWVTKEKRRRSGPRSMQGEGTPTRDLSLKSSRRRTATALCQERRSS
ncbi:hypothetical protein [Nonomuraea coxensis]|uniref:hypothetical protein n=1 Tax=Nonomuraea coxensis TaxID=404386 RepID=UPI003CCE7761